MMGYNLFLDQRLAEERMRDAMREAEQVRLIRAAKGAGAANQSALHGLFIKIRGLGLLLISVQSKEVYHVTEYQFERNRTQG